MLCDICTKNQATVHLTEIVDGQITELHLCERCAKEKSSQMEQQFGLSDLLAGLVDFGKNIEEKEDLKLKCANCKLTYREFKKVGRLGCSECYVTFGKYLEFLLKSIHGANQHVGKLPNCPPFAKTKERVKAQIM
jgi:protein arginine kinase activator